MTEEQEAPQLHIGVNERGNVQFNNLELTPQYALEVAGWLIYQVFAMKAQKEAEEAERHELQLEKRLNQNQ